MITFLEGTLAEALPTQIVVAVQGVGYQVLIPLSSFDRLPAEGGKIKILTHLQVREDAHILYGFMTAEERDLFRLLVDHVSGIGPKLALAVLSGMPVKAFKAAVVNGAVAEISRVKGVGKKTAERIVLELKDKVGVAAAWEAASASLGPMPDTCSTSSRNRSRSSADMNPYRIWASSRTCRWVRILIFSPGAGSRSKLDSGIST